MKEFNLKNGKWSSLFSKGITVLSLLFVLQGKSCPSPYPRQSGAAGHMVTKMTDVEFKASVANIEDVSCWVDQKERHVLFSAVKYGEDEKIKMILERFLEKKNTNFKHKNEDFMNTADPSSKITPLGQAIIRGYITIFNYFIQNECIDINRKSKGRAPLLLTFKYNRKEMAHSLLKNPTIDIKAQTPDSHNTTLHWAIKTRWADIAKTLIDRLNTEAPELLFAQNKDGDTPLHLAVKYKLPDVQSKLIEVLPEEKIWIKNNKDQAPVDIAMENNQANMIGFLYQAPLERLCEENNNGQTRLHVAARLHLKNAFQAILKRIIELSGRDKAVTQLFEKTKKGKSVWMSIILSEFGTQPVFDNINIEMLNNTINLVKDNLTQAHRSAILDEINKLEHTSTLAGGISNKYADKLRNIINTVPAA